ncbi:MAG: MCE family protein [Deltaproteobacteria bacterium]|nr:MAG: MCE family protein [Deltaproteobacteria bacterium]
MRDRWKSAKVGLLVVVIVTSTYLVWRFVDERAGGEGGYTVWAVFPDAQGLVPKSRVRIAGIDVGYIDSIRLWGDQARVDIQIDEGIVLYEDAKVAKRTASILGEALLALIPGTEGNRVVEAGEQIPVLEDAPSTDDILRSVGQTAESVERIAAQVERVFGTDRGGDQMASALENLSEALAGVNRTIQQNESVIAATLRNLEQTTDVAGPQLVRILDNVESVTGDVRDIVGENAEGLTEAGGQVNDTVSAINRAAHQLEDVMGDLEEITGRTAAGEGTIGRLTSDEQLIDEIQGIAEGIGDIVGPIARLQTIVELRSEYNMLANTFKNYVSLRLQPREDRYYLIQLIDDPRGRTQFSQTTVRRSPPPDDEPASYTETRITTNDDFRFSLQFAKRIAFATFRFGVIESTGGIGADIHLFDDDLEMNIDIFAFGDNTFPRLRARIAYEIVSRLWILGGVDDAINETADFFLGAQLRFNDEDLKSILPFVPAGAGG